MSDRILPPWFEPVYDMRIRQYNADATDQQIVRQGRSEFIGGTDVAAILGVDPVRTPYSVWLKKRGAPEPEEDRTNTPARWGIVFERPIAEEYGRMHGLTVGKWPGLVLAEYPRLVMHGDFWAREIPAGIEVKTRSEFKRSEFGREGSDEIPPSMLCQVLWYLALSGAPEWRVPIVFGGNRLETFVVFRDAKLCDQIVERVMAWAKRHLDDGVPVEPSEADGTLAFEEARRLFPHARRRSLVNVSDDPEKIELLLKYRDATRTLALAEQTEALIKSMICREIGDADGIEGVYFTDDDRIPLRATWTEQKGRTTTDYAGAVQAVRNWLQLVASSCPDQLQPGAKDVLARLEEEIAARTKTGDSFRVFRPSKVLAGKADA